MVSEIRINTVLCVVTLQARRAVKRQHLQPPPKASKEEKQPSESVKHVVSVQKYHMTPLFVYIY